MPQFRHFLEWFDRQREEITDTALGLDLRAAHSDHFQFAPQPQDLDVEDILMTGV